MTALKFTTHVVALAAMLVSSSSHAQTAPTPEAQALPRVEVIGTTPLPGLGTALRDPANEARRLATLSAREFEVFRLLAQGHSLNDCAAALKLSPKTVSNHQTLIKEKLGVATSAALAHLAIRHGVISSSGG